MPSNSQQTILNAFRQALPTGGADAADSLTTGLMPGAEQTIAEALSLATQAIHAQTQATGANTDALSTNSQAASSSHTAKDVLGAVTNAGGLLGGGLSLMPLFSLFSGLFGGDQAQPPAPLTPYLLPPSIDVETTTDQRPVSWAENGMPRPVGDAPQRATPQVTVQVQAMDSQSFLDHSHEIAQAVRQAMLNMNALNDVVGNL